jgi:hypothetical protein
MNKCKLVNVILILSFFVIITMTACSSSSEYIAPQSSKSIDNLATLTYVDVPAVFKGFSSAGMVKLQPTEVELDTDLPKLPGELLAYEVVGPNINDEYARNLAHKIGLEKEWPLTGGERVAYSYTKDTQSLEINLSGYIRFEQSVNISDTPKSLPADQECIDIARNWLISADLYPSNVIRTEEGYGGKSVASMDPQTGKPGPLVYYSKQVSFIVNLGNYEGSALGAWVLIGENGKVIKAEINMPQYKDYGLVKIKTPQAALDVLKAYLSRLTPKTEIAPECMYNTDGARVVIKNITLRYVGTYKTGYILPIYVFEGYAYRGDNPEPEKFTGRVDAVEHQTR